MGLFQDLFQNVVLRVIERTITDSEALREFIRNIVRSLDALAERTATELDDKLVEAVAYVVNNDDAWAWIHQAVITIYQQIVNGDDVDVDTLVKSAEENAKLDPVLIATIITAIVELLKLWRERRQ